MKLCHQRIYKGSSKITCMKGNVTYKYFSSSRKNVFVGLSKTKLLQTQKENLKTANFACNPKVNFSTLSRYLAILSYKNIRNKLFKCENGRAKLQKCKINTITSAQELEERNRREQRHQYECCDKKKLEARKKRENFAELGCCLLSVAPKLQWAEDVPWDECFPCSPPCPKDIPLKRLKRRFKDKDVHLRCPLPEKCIRLDDGLIEKPKRLPKLSPRCKPCEVELPSILPKIPNLKKCYDDTKMKYPHICIPAEPPCAPRLDDICPLRYKRLRKFKPSTDCKPCVIPVPTINPRLKKLKFEYIDPPKECVEIICEWKPDQKKHKKLRKLKFGKCNPCRDFPTVSPKLKRLKKRFKSSKFKWIQICEDPCKCPPRLDAGLQVIPKKLKKIPSTCLPCTPKIPTYAPELKRLHKSYDDQIDSEWECIVEDPCTLPRLDAELPIKKKKLRKYTAGNCIPCTPEGPTICPPLPKLKRAFKDRDPIRVCDKPEEPCLRLDGDIRIERTILPDMAPSLIPCLPCEDGKPTISPKLVRLRRRLPELDRVPCNPLPDTCNICPPRLDDICCEKPKAKCLPPFNPRMYPPPDDSDYCYRAPFKFVCCSTHKKMKSRACRLPRKKCKTVDRSCKCPKPH